LTPKFSKLYPVAHTELFLDWAAHAPITEEKTRIPIMNNENRSRRIMNHSFVLGFLYNGMNNLSVS